MSQQPDSSPRITRRLETPTVDPARTPGDGKAGPPDKAALAALARDAHWHVTESEKWSRFKLGAFDPGPAITVWWNPDGSARAAEITDSDGEPMATASADVAGWVRGQISSDITERPSE